MLRIVPSAVTMPVNIQAFLVNSVSMSSPSGVSAMRAKRGMASSRSMPNACTAGQRIAAHDGGCMEPGDAVHQVGPQQRGGKLGAALDQQPGEPGVAQRRERPGWIDADLRARAPR